MRIDLCFRVNLTFTVGISGCMCVPLINNAHIILRTEAILHAWVFVWGWVCMWGVCVCVCVCVGVCGWYLFEPYLRFLKMKIGTNKNENEAINLVLFD